MRFDYSPAKPLGRATLALADGTVVARDVDLSVADLEVVVRASAAPVASILVEWEEVDG